MENEELNQIEGFQGTYSTPNYGGVMYKIKIVGGVALWWFSDRRLARDFYNIKKQNGSDVSFRERLNSVGERFHNKTKQEIMKIIAKEHEELTIYNKKK